MLYYHQENQVKLEKLNKSAHYFVMGPLIYPQNKVCSKISYRHFKAIDTKLNSPRKWEYRNKGCLIVQKKVQKFFIRTNWSLSERFPSHQCITNLVQFLRNYFSITAEELSSTSTYLLSWAHI